MSGERDKMTAGEVYDPTDERLFKEWIDVKDLVWEYNRIRPSQIGERRRLLKLILGACDDEVFINQPFFCDYGKNMFIGKRFFANYNFTVLDNAPVTIGDDVFVGPNVSVYTACHSTHVEERNTRMEWAKPVTICNNCWIGGSVTILPGVTIGEGCTIGAGSVVTRDIPPHSLAVGNPAKVIKHLK